MLYISGASSGLREDIIEEEHSYRDYYQDGTQPVYGYNKLDYYCREVESGVISSRDEIIERVACGAKSKS
jgi:hypothetical protein